MSDLFRNHIVGFLTRWLICCSAKIFVVRILIGSLDIREISQINEGICQQKCLYLTATKCLRVLKIIPSNC